MARPAHLVSRSWGVRAWLPGVGAGGTEVAVRSGPDGHSHIWVSERVNVRNKVRMAALICAIAVLPDVASHLVVALMTAISALRNGELGGFGGHASLFAARVPSVGRQWLAGALLCGAPFVVGGFSRLTTAGRQRLRWHGAEHASFGGHGRHHRACGSRVFLLAATWIAFVTVSLAVVRPEWTMLSPPWLLFRLGLSGLMLALASERIRRPSIGGGGQDLRPLESYLQAAVTMAPTDAELRACHELAKAVARLSKRRGEPSSETARLAIG